MIEAWKRALVLAPRTDDAELGAVGRWPAPSGPERRVTDPPGGVSVSLPLFVSVELQPLERVRRDLGADELWERSLARSRERRRAKESRRSLVSAALADLDGPGGLRVSSTRDLSDPELWDISATLAHGKRLAAEPGLLPQARVAGATLVVAAVAAALPVPNGSATRARSSGTTRVHVELLKFGSRGPAVTRVQRALRIAADGIFGPQTRRAVRAFQKRHGLLVDGIVGPQTRKALFDRAPAEQRFIRAWWVVPVQRALGVPADGLYGPVSRAAVRKYQQRKGLIVDGVVGPQTLGSLGIRRPAAGGSGGGGGGGGKASAPRPSSRGARVASIATRYLGVPYRWGGSSPSTGFDCSGFVMYLYRQVGVSLPHNAAMQYRHGRAVSRGSLRRGDIVFFNGLGHNGVYLGGGRFIHSPSSGDVVKVSRLGEGWYSSRYVGARRL
jgi:cell wall-associated NlpC family hydrolase